MNCPIANQCFADLLAIFAGFGLNLYRQSRCARPRRYVYDVRRKDANETLRTMTVTPHYRPCWRVSVCGPPFELNDISGTFWKWTTSRFRGQSDRHIIKGGGWGNNLYCLLA